MKRLFAATSAFLTTALALLTLRLVKRYAVDGRSMLRAYAPGDRVLVERLTYRLRPPRPGDVVVLRQPDGRQDIKRIAAGPGAVVMAGAEERVLGDDEWFVLGDNLSESTDSRTLGPVKTSEIVGRVWRKY